MLRKIKNINNEWFFKDLPWYCKCGLMYIRGDILVLIPFLFLLFFTAFISFRFFGIALGTYIAVRSFFEVMYWLLQQFSERKYRPYDYGLKKLDNNAIYIIYQTTSTAWVVIGILIIFYFLL